LHGLYHTTYLYLWCTLVFSFYMQLTCTLVRCLQGTTPDGRQQFGYAYSQAYQVWRRPVASSWFWAACLMGSTLGFVGCQCSERWHDESLGLSAALIAIVELHLLPVCRRSRSCTRSARPRSTPTTSRVRPAAAGVRLFSRPSRLETQTATLPHEIHPQPAYRTSHLPALPSALQHCCKTTPITWMRC